MTPSALFAWRSRMGWSVSEAAKQLGVSRRGYGIYEKGWVDVEKALPAVDREVVVYTTVRRSRPIPRHIELACERLEQIATNPPESSVA